MFPALVAYAGSARVGTTFGMLPWEALIVVPVPCFVAGLLWLGRYERMLRQVASEGGAA